jgi:hypothetical protein
MGMGLISSLFFDDLTEAIDLIESSSDLCNQIEDLRFFNADEYLDLINHKVLSSTGDVLPIFCLGEISPLQVIDDID